ncbi:MAG TPA: YidC/Oxa1 family membrane protein insertase [bacterium]|nr:YidC/Oxa1 family membrane protein insertase [bacterium]
MSNIWNVIFLNPIFNILVIFYDTISNLGLSIFLFTVLIKFILIPLTIPSLKMSKKQRDIQPELNKIRQKYKYDKRKQAEMQMELFKKHGINTGAGCLTSIVMMTLMIAICNSVRMLTMNPDLTSLNERIYFEQMKFDSSKIIDTKFLYLDLSKPDPYLILTVITVLLQFISTKMVSPYTETSEKAAKQTPEKSDDMMAMMQKQNMYIMPIMFFFFGITLPSGVMIYIATSTLFQIVQTYFFSGWGGLKPWINKLKFAKKTL